MTSAKTEKRLKGCHWRLPPVVSKYEFVQINLELITAYAVVSSNQPLLEVANCPVREWHNGLRALSQVNS